MTDNVREPIVTEPASSTNVFYLASNPHGCVCAFLAEDATPCEINGQTAPFEPAVNAFIIGSVSAELVEQIAVGHRHVRVLGIAPTDSTTPANVDYVTGDVTDHLLMINNPAVFTLIDRVRSQTALFTAACNGAHIGQCALTLCSGATSFEKVDRHFTRGEIMLELCADNMLASCELAPILTSGDATVCAVPMSPIIVGVPNHPKLATVTHMLYYEYEARDGVHGWRFVCRGPDPERIVGARVSPTISACWLPVDNAKAYLPHIYPPATPAALDTVD